MNTYYTNEFGTEEMYPEIYKELYPIVSANARDFMRKGHPLTDEALRLLIDETIKSAGLWDEDDDAEVFSASSNPRRQPSRRRPRRRHHNRNTLRDLLRILYLRELLNRRF